MKKFAFAAIVSTGLIAAYTSAQTPGLKAGLWEIKTTRQVMDGRDMTAMMTTAMEKMQQAMANMSPEQRKQMEGMVGNAIGVGSSGGVRICVSPAMAAKNQPMVDKDGQCAPAKVTHSGNKSTFEFSCTQNGRSTTGTGTSIADGDSISTSVVMTITDAKGNHTMQSDSVMTFAGSDCQGITPADQIAQKSAPH
jgi:hypothetical protein